MGVFEKEPSAAGTKAVWEAAGQRTKGLSAVGGGDSVAAANLFGVGKKIGYICTGGALVRFLSGEELPVVKALKGRCGERLREAH